MKKCSMCRKRIIALTPCWILSEGRILYGRSEWYRKKFPSVNAEPEHWGWEVQKFVNRPLCDECVSKKYTLKHTKWDALPIPVGDRRVYEPSGVGVCKE